MPVDPWKLGGVICDVGVPRVVGIVTPNLVGGRAV
jgi:hypothetical protein